MISTCVATAKERERSMPGDVLIPAPAATFTHAISIGASPRQVWPWLAQMGAGRGGWYAYDFLDNGGVPSAEVVLPDLQTIQVGDLMPAVPGATRAFVVAGIQRDHDLVLTALRPDRGLRMTWELLLEPRRPHGCRLLVRARLSERWFDGLTDAAAGAPALAERACRLLPALPGSLRLRLRAAAAAHRVVQARMLRGIKRRAERRSGGIPITLPRRRLVDRLLPRAAVAERRQAQLRTGRG